MKSYFCTVFLSIYLSINLSIVSIYLQYISIYNTSIYSIYPSMHSIYLFIYLQYLSSYVSVFEQHNRPGCLIGQLLASKNRTYPSAFQCLHFPDLPSIWAVNSRWAAMWKINSKICFEAKIFGRASQPALQFCYMQA